MLKDPIAGIGWINQKKDYFPKPAIITSIEDNSIADDLGFQPGDRILSINGKRPRDLIDVHLLIGSENLTIILEDCDNFIHLIELTKNTDEGLGLGFTEALFDGLKQCNNKCTFCFIDQQPSGSRNSLYLKDDDFRLSFLYGSYLTLTNLGITDWQRIQNQRLSPLYVSIHTTDPRLRSHLLINQRGKLIIDQLHWFSENRLQIHAQIVICPGFNDGPALQRTLIELYQFATSDPPCLLSIAVVPVGLTHFRPIGDKLISADEECAKRIINQVEELQVSFHKNLGSRLVWLSDEWFLIAQRPLPPVKTYESLSQQENGVGSIRVFIKKLDECTHNLPECIPNTHSTYSWVVGQLVSNTLKPVVERINKVRGIHLILYGLPSIYWGQDQAVTGLLTGTDILIGLQTKNLGDLLFLPSVLLQSKENVFLDDLAVELLKKVFPIPMKIVLGPTDIIKICVKSNK